MIPFSFVVLFFVFRAVLNEGKNSYGCYVVENEKEIAVGVSCILDMFSGPFLYINLRTRTSSPEDEKINGFSARYEVVNPLSTGTMPTTVTTSTSKQNTATFIKDNAKSTTK